MIENMIVGGGFAFAAAVQPGPLQAFLLSRVAAVGWKRTLPAALAPIISDGPIAILMLVLLHSLARGFESFLRGAGGIVLLYFATRAFIEWRSASRGTISGRPSAPRTLLHAVAVNIVNPGPYLGWSLILGPLVLQEWAHEPQNAVALIMSFYVVMVLCLATFILIVGTTTFLGARGRRILLLASSFALAGLGVYSLLAAFR
jgi:threonine/homoserine/homoserine lactone efflux protein